MSKKPSNLLMKIFVIIVALSMVGVAILPFLPFAHS